MYSKTQSYKLQHQLAEYCRTGKEVTIAGTKKHRLPQYRRLVFNVILNTLEQAYPLTFDLLSSKVWKDTLQHFFANHHCKENEVWKMPHDFLTYAQEQQLDKKLETPYLLELLTLEWTEIAIFGMQNVSIQTISITDVKEDKLLVNPYLEILHFSYPVHKKKQQENLDFKGDYYVLCYRDLDNDKVFFVEITAIGAFVLKAFQEQLTLQEIVEQLESVNGRLDQNYTNNIDGFIQEMLQRKVLVGKLI